MCLVGLTRGFQQNRRFLWKRHSEHVRSSAHGNAALQVLVHLGVGGLIIFRDPRLLQRWFHREQLHPLFIQQQLEIVGFAQPLDMLVAVSHQSELDLILAVQRKRVVDHRTATCADREAVEVPLLGEVRWNPDGVAAWRTAGAADGHPADLLRRRYIPVQ